MQTQFRLFLFMFFLLFPTITPASYLMELSTGSSIIAEQYWEENGQVKFYHYGNLVGIPAHMVLSINEINMLEPGPHSETKLDESKAAVIQAEADTDNEQAFTEEDATTYQNELDRINTEFASTLDFYRLVKEENNDASMKQALSSLSRLRVERRELRQKVSSLYGGTLPEWWTEWWAE